ncbi:DMT family transporter [Lentibacillus cibarius]|uniref:QacE family quaternary ammonium compound efflux SMR transporter n=1 Tax=Lentibacillus cibarius TaxID=2583219 RepID=A0A5S3QLQ1_9BACI|nr:SMR family transporter [Lentibacillus cibarius]TMN22151.1 QacE family quaternary ammonium compound efflux SMR transporter [Lentibacillus cibarius]
MGWLFILVASVFEIIGVIGLQFASQNRSIRNVLMYIGGFGGSVAMLNLSFAYLQVTIAYAVWVGIGTAGAVLLSIFFFGESGNWSRICSLAVIIVGVVGLKAVS